MLFSEQTRSISKHSFHSKVLLLLYYINKNVRKQTPLQVIWYFLFFHKTLHTYLVLFEYSSPHSLALLKTPSEILNPCLEQNRNGNIYHQLQFVTQFIKRRCWGGVLIIHV